LTFFPFPAISLQKKLAQLLLLIGPERC